MSKELEAVKISKKIETIESQIEINKNELASKKLELVELPLYKEIRGLEGVNKLQGDKIKKLYTNLKDLFLNGKQKD